MIKQIFQHFALIFKRFIPQWRLYGFPVAFWSFMHGFKHLWLKRFRFFVAVKKHRAILQYLHNRYINVIKDFAEKEKSPESGIKPDSTIWVCWWDGEENMPPLVKACYNLIKRHAGKHPVILITKDNFSDYIFIPEFILEKANKKEMTKNMLANIIRVSLLYEHGGIWLDVTLLVLKDISIAGLPFYSLKTTSKTFSVSHTLLQLLSSSPASLNKQSIPEINHWSTFLLAGAKHSLIFVYIRDMFYAYWKEHNDLIDYFLFDYIIALGYDNIPCIKNNIDNVANIDYNKFSIEKILDSEYSEEKFALLAGQTFYKLTWKKKFNTYTKNNKLTVYGYLIS